MDPTKILERLMFLKTRDAMPDVAEGEGKHHGGKPHKVSKKRKRGPRPRTNMFYCDGVKKKPTLFGKRTQLPSWYLESGIVRNPMAAVRLLKRKKKAG